MAEAEAQHRARSFQLNMETVRLKLSLNRDAGHALCAHFGSSARDVGNGWFCRQFRNDEIRIFEEPHLFFVRKAWWQQGTSLVRSLIRLEIKVILVLR
jgi:hypothetical protein